MLPKFGDQDWKVSEFLKWDHPLQASTLYDIAKVHMLRGGRYQKVIDICDVIIQIRKDKLCEEHIDIARTLCMKGSCYVTLGENDQGMMYLSNAISMAIQCMGNENHPIIAEIYTEISIYHLQKCEFDDARTYSQKALNIYCWSTNLDDDYYGIQYTKQVIQRIDHDELLCV